MGPLERTKGFSTVKFVPYRYNELIVIKTTEVDTVESFIMVMDMSGKILMEPEKIPGKMKFEGVEFL